MAKIRKLHTIDPELQQRFDDITKELSKNGMKFSQSAWIEGQIEKFVKDNEHLIKRGAE